MYNRYIPQPDGSHRRNRVPDPSRQEPPRHRPAQPPCPPPEPICDPPDEIPCAPPPRPVPPPKAGGRRPSRPKEPESISGFLKKLLPKDLRPPLLRRVLLAPKEPPPPKLLLPPLRGAPLPKEPPPNPPERGDGFLGGVLGLGGTTTRRRGLPQNTG